MRCLCNYKEVSSNCLRVELILLSLEKVKLMQTDTITQTVLDFPI